MYQFEINQNEAGQRFDKYLHKLLPKAPSSFFYKMLRKKNIVLNGKKAEGKEKLAVGDQVRLFLSEETFLGFSGRPEELKEKENAYRAAYRKLTGIQVIFENEHMVLLNKPSGMLTQKAQKSDLSLNEWLIGYLLSRGLLSEKDLATYKPSVCNRLDRNTSGLVICAKSLFGSRELNAGIANRTIRKFYRLFVRGSLTEQGALKGYLLKEEGSNKVRLFKEQVTGSSPIETRYQPLMTTSEYTYLEAELITGKTHQIRAHFASLGHPLLGDLKYGGEAFFKETQKRYGISSQLLHAFRLVFPEDSSLLSREEGCLFTAEEPEIFQRLLSG